MSTTLRLVSFTTLIERLAGVLGAESGLLRELEAAFRTQDADRVDTAMAGLRAYPVGLRQEVEGVILDWLFTAEDGRALAALPAASPAIN